MTNLAKDSEVVQKESGLLSFKMAAVKLFKGCIAKINAAGYLDHATAESGAVFAGIVTGAVDNSAGSAGDKEARVFTKGVFLLTTNGSALTIADVGSKVYASDSATCSIVQASNEVEIGKIVEVVSTTSAYVEIKTY